MEQPTHNEVTPFLKTSRLHDQVINIINSQPLVVSDFQINSQNNLNSGPKNEARKRGRPRKYFLGEVSTPIQTTNKSYARLGQDADDSIEDIDRSGDDFQSNYLYPRRSTRSVYNTGPNASHGEYSATNDENDDEALARRLANQKMNLREKRSLNSTKVTTLCTRSDEDLECNKRRISLSALRKNKSVRVKKQTSDDDEDSDSQVEESGIENDYERYSGEGPDNDESLIFKSKNRNNNGLSVDLEHKSTQIEKILAYRISKSGSPSLETKLIDIKLESGLDSSTADVDVLNGSNVKMKPECDDGLLAYKSITRKILDEINSANSGGGGGGGYSKTSVVSGISNDGVKERTYAKSISLSTQSGQSGDCKALVEVESEVVKVESDPFEIANNPQDVSNTKFNNQLRYEYLVKYKKKSYLHCEWLPEIVVEKAKLGKQRLQRFLMAIPELDPDPPFDPDYTVVDRILDKEVRNGKTWYFVKWYSLPYNESTWEPADIINDAKAVEKYEMRNKIPSVKIDHTAPVIRPNPSSFRQLLDLEFKDGNKLKPYQLEGVNWLRSCWYNHRNSILADEMGLGKTVQTVSILWYLYKFQNIRGPFLIVVLLSTISHWLRELETWADMNVLLYHGNSEARKIMRDYEFYYRDENGNRKYKNMFKFHVVVTTYEMILTDTDILRPINWKYVAIDEAHKLKNQSSRVLIELRYFKYDHLLLLTGTPIQNNTQELWTLLNLLDPVKFASLEEFLENFGNLQDAEQATKLQNILHPYLLRRMKEDVEKTIARKEETIIEVELTTIQKKYYRAVLERSFDNLVQGSRSKSCLPSLLNIMMQLRKCCNHPYLLRGVEETELGIAAEGEAQQLANETLIESSGKLVLIDKLLPCLKAEGHKILIFSQMVRMLDILEDYLNYRGYKHERIDGSVRSNDRQAAIDRFSRPDSEIFVFLLCTKAGGVGINLTAADTVIIFDSDWNPQNDLQAQARCHRIGQQKNVQVYRLLMRGTYERVMFERASLKLGLDQAVLNRISSDEDGEIRSKFSSSEVDTLLKHGAYDLFREDDKSSERFREENIEEILSKRTTRIVHNSSSGGANSLLSKASFASEQANADLDVNDPDFWKKVMPNQVDRPDPNILVEPRQRRSVNRVENSIENSDSDLGSDNENDSIASDDDVYMDSESRKDGSKGDRRRKVVGPYFQSHNWNITQRNRFVRAVQLMGFGRWREIKRNAKLTNKSLKEIAYYGRAYLHKIVSFATLAEGDNIDKIIGRIINCDDGIEDLTEDPWRSSVPSHVAAYKMHKEESEEGMSPEELQRTIERYEYVKSQEALKHERDKEYLDRKMTYLREGTIHQQPMGVETIEMGGLGPSCSTKSSPDAPDDDKLNSENSIVIFWHLNDKEMEEEVNIMLNDPMLNDPRFLENVKSTATQTIRRFELLAEIGSLVRSNFGEFADESFPKIETGDPNYFGEKWTPQFDRDLLFGTWRWGFGQYEKMARDPLLSFYGIYKSKPSKEKSNSGDGENEEDYDNEDEEGEDGKRKIALKKTLLEKSPDGNKSNDDVAEFDLKSTEDKDHDFNTVGSLDDGADADTMANNSGDNHHLDASASQSVKGKVVDKLTGNSGDGSVVFDDSQLLQLPPSKLLTHRVKHILKMFSIMRKKRIQKEQKERKRLEKEREREEKQKRKEDKEAAWSKKDRSEFYRVLTTFGICLNDEGEEDWQDFFSKCRLGNKTIKSLQTFYRDFVSVCRYIKAHRIKNTTGLNRLEDGSSDYQENTDGIVAKVDQFKLTNSQVKKVLERLALFNCIRALFFSLDMDQIKSKLASIGVPISGFGLPEWWNPAVDYDYSLLLGVNVHGIGRWENLTADPDLSFYVDTSQAPSCGEDVSGGMVVKSDTEVLGLNDANNEISKQIYRTLPAEKLLMRRLIFLVHHLNTTGVEWRPRKNGPLDPLPAFEEEFDEQIHEIKTIISGAASSSVKSKKRRKQENSMGETHHFKKRSLESYLLGGDEEVCGAAPSTHEKGANIEYDSQGNIIYPIKLKGTLSIDSLGMLSDRPAFHSDKYVWPLGFTSHREYSSTINPEKRSLYRSEILTSQDGNSPVFRVTPEDDPSNFVEAPTASQAWKMIINKVNKLKPDKSKRTSVSGPEYFGFGNSKISQLISNLPSTGKCPNIVQIDDNNECDVPQDGNQVN